MKTLYVVRHAKSDWANADVLRDIDRPLNKRGVRNAYEMAARFKQNNQILPDKIISSNGIRALHTAVIFTHQIGFSSAKIQITPNLYHASVDDIVASLKAVENSQETIMIFGHNPGFSDFVSYTSKESYLHMPTCAMATIQIAIKDWKDFSFEACTLQEFDFPKKKS